MEFGAILTQVVANDTTEIRSGPWWARVFGQFAATQRIKLAQRVVQRVARSASPDAHKNARLREEELHQKDTHQPNRRAFDSSIKRQAAGRA